MLKRLLPLACATLLLTAGCGSDDDNPTVQQTAAPLASLLPQSIRDKGTLVVGSDTAYAPVEFIDTDGKTIIGIDPDLAKALGNKLGITLKFQTGIFDGLITELTKSKRIDLIMSAMSDNKERQKSIDFVDYFTVGTSILVKKGNPEGIKTLDDFCGKTIALQRGTTQDVIAEQQAKKCGSNKLTILKFDRDTEALLKVKSGGAVADMNDFPVAAYTTTKDSSFEVVGEQIQAGPYGIGVRKEDSQLRDALKAALQAIIDDGTYKQILDKWKVAQGAVPTATVNAGT